MSSSNASNKSYYEAYSHQISVAFEQLQKELETDKRLIERQKATITGLKCDRNEKFKELDVKYREVRENEKRIRSHNQRLANDLKAERKKSSAASISIASLESKITDLEANWRGEREENQRRINAKQQEITNLKRKFDAEVLALKAAQSNQNHNRNTYEVLIYDNPVNNAAIDNVEQIRAETRNKDLEAQIKLLKEKNANYEKTIKEMSTKGIAFRTQMASVKDMMRDMMTNGKQEKTMIDRMRSVDAMRVNEVANLKRKYEAEISKLTKQKKYQMDLNQKLKKKLLATQYTFGGHEMIRKATSHQLSTMMRTNNRNMLMDLKRSIDQALSYAAKKSDEQNENSVKLVNSSAQSQSDCIYNKAKEIVKITSKCPDCERPFEDIASLKKHMTMFHMKQYSDEFVGPIVVERSPAKRKRGSNNGVIVDIE